MTDYYPNRAEVWDYWRQELQRFREMMCSTRFRAAQIEAALRGLTYLYLDFPQEDPKAQAVVLSFKATLDEYQRRMAYRDALGYD